MLLETASPTDRQLEKHFKEWLVNSHRQYDRSVKFEVLCHQSAQVNSVLLLAETVSHWLVGGSVCSWLLCICCSYALCFLLQHLSLAGSPRALCSYWKCFPLLCKTLCGASTTSGRLTHARSWGRMSPSLSASVMACKPSTGETSSASTQSRPYWAG